jgi:hypothetical protein
VPVTIASVNEYGEAQWQSVLLALVEGRSSPLKPHSQLEGLKLQKHFKTAELLDDHTELTEKGFAFLFADLYSQLWQLVEVLLKHYQEVSVAGGGEEMASALSFLLQLAFRKVCGCGLCRCCPMRKFITPLPSIYN